MALNHFAAHAPNLGGDWLVPGAAPALNPRVNQIHARNSSTTPTTQRNNTVNMFIDAENGDVEYAASIVSVCADKTVYAIRCTAWSGSKYDTEEACGPDGPELTMTGGSSTYDISYETRSWTRGVELTGIAIETCVLAGTTAATCAATAIGRVQGQSTAASTTETLTGTDYHRFDVEITAGATKTLSPAATCGPKGANGAGGGGGESAGSSLRARSTAVWALVGSLGVAGLLAMA